MADYKIFTRNGTCEANTYFVVFGPEVLVIDASNRFDRSMIPEGTVKAVLLTHGHFDHIIAAEDYVKKFSCPIYVSKEELSCFTDPELNVSACFGFATILHVEAKTWDSNTITSEELGFSEPGLFTVKVIPTPGHSEGSVCFLLDIGGEKMLFTGDTLFRGTVGRIDLPGGSAEKMQESIKLLSRMDDDLLCFPGHGEPTTIGQEKQYNLYFGDISVDGRVVEI